MDIGVTPALQIEQFHVRGMTCASCVRHVREALEAVPGVLSAAVDIGSASATISHASGQTLDVVALRGAVADAGYELGEAQALAPGSARLLTPFLRPLGVAVLAALGLLAFYLGIITLAQGWSHAIQQLLVDRWFVAALVAGFGTQMGLFSYLRQLHVACAARGVATSTGTSATAMLACCAHHLAEIAPLVGLSGAVVFLNAYKTPLLWLGIVMNGVGSLYLLHKVVQARRMADAGVSP